MNGGNDYKLETEDKNVKRSFLTRKMWAYSNGDSLFLNCRQLELQTWYTDLIGDGRYMIFRAVMSRNSETAKNKRSSEALAGTMFGLIGGIAAATSNASMNLLRFLYVLDKESGNVIAVDENTLKLLLSGTPSLQEDFMNEPDRADEDVQIKYLEALNEHGQSR